VIRRLLQREMPLLPKIGFPCVDVRDVAKVHLKAMTTKEAAGNRHITITKWLWFKDIALVLEREYKTKGYRVPTSEAPYLLAKIGSWFDATIRMVIPQWNKELKLDNSRIRNVLGIQPIPLEQTIVDMANSMIEKGFIKRPSG